MRRFLQPLEYIDEDVIIPTQKIPKKPSILGLYFTLSPKAKDKCLFFAAVVASLASGIFTPIFIYNLGTIINGLGPKNTNNEIVVAFSDSQKAFLWSGLAMGVSFLFHIWLWAILGTRISIRFKEEYFELIFKQDQKWFDQHSAYPISTKLDQQMYQIQDAISEKLAGFCHFFAMLVGSTILGFVTAWKMTLVLLCFVPIISVTSIFIQTPMGTKVDELKMVTAETGSFVEEILIKIKTVSLFANFLLESKTYEEKITHASKLMKHKNLWISINSMIYHLIIWGLIAFGVWYGSRLIVDKDVNTNSGKILGAGDVCVVLVILRLATLGVVNMYLSYQGLKNMCGIATDYYIMKKKEMIMAKIIEKEQIRPHLYEQIKGELKINIKSFRYPKTPNRVALRNINLEFQPGTISVIVGESGAGKSTIFDLIVRFYNLDRDHNGYIELDGVSINNLEKNFLRKVVSLIPADPMILNIPIYRNILLGRNPQTYPIEMIKDACIKVSIDEFIQKLDGQYNFVPGSRGESLSLGERQRISIARGILGKPRILLLDEPTSFLDYINEKNTIKVIENLTKEYNLTTIIITHNLGFIRKGYRIIAMKNGEVIEQGTHLDLLKKKGYYSSLVENRLLKDKYYHHMAIKKSSQRLIPYREEESDDFIPKETQISLKNEEIEEEIEAKLTLWNLLSENKCDIIIIMFCAILNGASLISLAILLGYTIGILSLTNNTEIINGANFFSIMFLVVAIGTAIITFLQNYFFLNLEEKMCNKIKLLLFDKFIRMEKAFYEKEENKPGKLVSFIEIETSILHGQAFGVFVRFAENMSNLIVALIVGFIYDYRTTLILIGFLPFIFFSGFLHLKLKLYVANIEDQANLVAFDYMSQLLMNYKIIVLYNSQISAKKFFSNFLHQVNIKSLIWISFWSGCLYGLAIFISFAIYSTVFYAGGKFIVNGWTNFDNLMNAITPILFSAFVVFGNLELMTEYSKGKTVFEEIFKILNLKSKIDPFAKRSKENKSIENYKYFNGNITLQNICFKYPSRENISTINNMSLKIHEGDLVIFVGFSGSCKSTLFSLLMRFYDVDSGQILINNMNLKDLDLISYRFFISGVLSDTAIFNRSVRENIRYGDLNATDDEIEKVAEITLITNLLTVEDCSSLSNGEKQKIAIARALLRKPKVLLLDEPTLFIDEESATVITSNIIKYVKANSITCILIAKNIIDVQQASIIYFLDKGVIVEKGTHNKLMKLEGLYSYLYKQKEE